MTQRSEDLLFHPYTVSDSLRDNAARMLAEIDLIDGDELLNTNPEALCDYFEHRYKVDVPVICDDNIRIAGPREVEVGPDPNAMWLGPLRGTAITYHIPFDGEAALFKCRPSTFTLNPLRGTVQGMSCW